MPPITIFTKSNMRNWIGRTKKILDLSDPKYQHLTDINLFGSKVEQLINIPSSVIRIDLRGCKNLKSLDLLGCNNIRSVNLFDSSIEQLSNIPPSVTHLNLQNCTKLVLTREIATSITNIERNHTSACVLRPSHWGVNDFALLQFLEGQGVDFDEIGASGITVQHRIEHLRHRMREEIRRGEEVEGAEGGVAREAEGGVAREAEGGVAREAEGVGLGANEDMANRSRERLSRRLNMAARLNESRLIDEARRKLNEIVLSSGIPATPIYDPDTGETRDVYTTLYIFEKFATQNIHFGDRDRSLKDIISTATPIIELLEKDPSHLKWMDKMAEHYTQGCVNQPVQGFIEIAGFAGVCQKESVGDKMEASKQILARMAIISFFATLNPAERPGEEVEVEFANVLMREVNKKLLEDEVIKESWPGAPNRIAYEGIVEQKASLVFDRAYEYVKQEAVNLEHKEIAERLLGFLKGGAEGMDPPYRYVALAWMDAMIAGNEDLKHQSQEIDQKYEEEKERIMEEIVEKTDPEEQEDLGTQYKSIESNKESDKVEMIKKAVSRRILPEIPAAASPANSNTARRRRRLPAIPSTSIRGVTAAAVDDVQNARSS